MKKGEVKAPRRHFNFLIDWKPKLGRIREEEEQEEQEG